MFAISPSRVIRPVQVAWAEAPRHIAPFDAMPDDVLERIAVQLTQPTELARLGLVSRACRRVARRAVLWEGHWQMLGIEDALGTNVHAAWLRWMAPLHHRPQHVRDISHADGVGISAVALAGDTLVTGFENSTIGVWDAISGKLRHTLAGHGAAIHCVAIAGTRLASGSHDRTVRLWDATTGELLRTLREHTDDVAAVALTRHTLVSGSLDRSACICDAQSGDLRRKVTHLASVVAVAVTSDWVATGSSDKRVYVCEAKSGDIWYRAAAHQSAISAVGLSRRILVTASCDNTTRIWRLGAQRYPELIRTIAANNFPMSLAIAGETLIVGHYGGELRVYDARRKFAQRLSLPGHDKPWSISFAGNLLASIAGHHTVRIWRFSLPANASPGAGGGQEVTQLVGGDAAVAAIAETELPVDILAETLGTSVV